MMDFLSSRGALWVGAALLALVAIGAVIMLLRPSKEIAYERRRPGVPKPPGPITRVADTVTGAVGILTNGRAQRSAALLEQAGVRMPVREITVVLASIAIALFAAGLVFGSPLGGLLLALLVPVVFTIVLHIKADRRRAAFSDQLDESLQMLASSLRAGYSLLQAVQALATESSEPARDEFTRVVNETRVGRPVNEALENVAARMRSEDFFWVSQAIAINREVGGNLADVLDGVAHTIRERGSLRRQVRALSAEGKLSAYILFGLPFVVAGFLGNPDYLSTLVTNPIGWVMLAVGAILLVIGGFWLRASIQIKY